MVTVITVKPEQLRLLSILKSNNRKLTVKPNREEAVKRNLKIIKEYRKDIISTAQEY